MSMSEDDTTEVKDLKFCELCAHYSYTSCLCNHPDNIVTIRTPLCTYRRFVDSPFAKNMSNDCTDYSPSRIFRIKTWIATKIKRIFRKTSS